MRACGGRCFALVGAVGKRRANTRFAPTGCWKRESKLPGSEGGASAAPTLVVYLGAGGWGSPMMTRQMKATALPSLSGAPASTLTMTKGLRGWKGPLWERVDFRMIGART